MQECDSNGHTRHLCKARDLDNGSCDLAFYNVHKFHKNLHGRLVCGNAPGLFAINYSSNYVSLNLPRPVREMAEWAK
jgi:hypothetical protein